MHILNDLLSEIKDEVDTNSNLDYIVHTEIVQSFSVLNLEQQLHETPLCLIFPLSTQFTPVSFAVACEDHVYNIGLAIIIDNWGEQSYSFVSQYPNFKGVAEIESDVRTALNRNTFTYAKNELESFFTGATYSNLDLEDRSLAQVTCTLQYRYSDIG